ncbi:MAG: phosphoglycerate dehydrogenase [Phototrophicales bacterium]|nr:MAG: phosphoglycerate dehydrogenase [Phototrophicales bacterium]
MPQVLIPDNLDNDGLALLAKVDGLTYYAPGKMSRDEVITAIADADAMIVRSGTKCDAELLSYAEKLKVIVRAGVGVDNIDLEAATAKGIVVMNTPGGNTIATAELTIGLMLALARHIPQAQASLRSGKWERKKFTGTELYRKTLGLIGFGRIGQAVAKRAQAFEMTVIAHDPYANTAIAEQMGVPLLSLDEVFAGADYISLHALVTSETKNLICAENIAKMRDGVRIINAARGALINEYDLAEAIKSGKVAGAAVDVYTEEPPPPNHPLIGLENVVDTPHLGASTAEAQIAVAVEAAEKVIAALTKGTYQDVCNPEVLKQ